jgi:hypothetical protein
MPAGTTAAAAQPYHFDRAAIFSQHYRNRYEPTHILLNSGYSQRIGLLRAYGPASDGYD